MQYPRISKAKAVDDNTLIIEFSNEEVKEYKIHHLLEKPMFAPLRQPAFFKNFKIEPGGYALTWTEEIDVSEYELWKNGTAITQEAASISKTFQERRDLPQATKQAATNTTPTEDQRGSKGIASPSQTT